MVSVAAKARRFGLALPSDTCSTKQVLPGKLVNKSPCQYILTFPFVVAALLFVGGLAALARIVTYSTVV